VLAIGLGANALANWLAWRPRPAYDESRLVVYFGSEDGTRLGIADTLKTGTPATISPDI
jgi:hypothetical protein